MEGQGLMREIASIIGGMGLLIFAYLVFTNSSGVTTAAEGAASAGVSLITALQGRSAGA